MGCVAQNTRVVPKSCTCPIHLPCAPPLYSGTACSLYLAAFLYVCVCGRSQGDAHRRAIEAALDKRDLMIDVGVYNGLDQLSMLGYAAEVAVLAYVPYVSCTRRGVVRARGGTGRSRLSHVVRREWRIRLVLVVVAQCFPMAGWIYRYDYVWRTAKGSSGFKDESKPLYPLRPTDDMDCWPDTLCEHLACVPDGVDSFTPRDILNLCNCYRLFCVPTLVVETTKVNCFGRDRDDPGMLERIRQDLDKRHHFESKVERLNLPYVNRMDLHASVVCPLTCGPF
jgi:hypothetical protein